MIKRIIQKIKDDGIFSIFKSVLWRIKKKIYKLNVKLETIDNKHLNHLGTNYGGKTFIHLDELKGSPIVSCGLGEDASFDIEFAREYKSKVIIIDPTPRAIEHYNEFISRLGQAALEPYQNSGHEKSISYDLSGINKNQLCLDKHAIWTVKTNLRFYAPPNPKHVSYSINNIQNNYNQDDESDFIEVETITIEEVKSKYSINGISLLKLDIEGAEIDVLNHLLNRNIRPTQICVEFDGLNFPNRKVINQYKNLDEKLRKCGYLCYSFDGFADYTYALKSKVPY